MLLCDAQRTDGIVAGLAVGVDLGADVFLAARNPLDWGISGQSLFKKDLLVRSGGLALFVGNETRWSNMLITVHAVDGGILILAEIALHHSVDVSLVGLGGLDQ